MASDKKIAANRENAKKSTGPTSERGKGHSRLNARADGFYTVHALPGEEPGWIDQLWGKIVESYQPVGIFEQAELRLALEEMVRLVRVGRVEFRHLTQLMERAARDRLQLEEGANQSPEGDKDLKSEDLDEALYLALTEANSLSHRLEELRERGTRRLSRHIKNFFALKQERSKNGQSTYFGDPGIDDSIKRRDRGSQRKPNGE